MGSGSFKRSSSSQLSSALRFVGVVGLEEALSNSAAKA